MAVEPKVTAFQEEFKTPIPQVESEFTAPLPQCLKRQLERDYSNSMKQHKRFKANKGTVCEILNLDLSHCQVEGIKVGKKLVQEYTHNQSVTGILLSKIDSNQKEIKLRDIHRNDWISIFFPNLKDDQITELAQIELFSKIKLANVSVLVSNRLKLFCRYMGEDLNGLSVIKPHFQQCDMYCPCEKLEQKPLPHYIHIAQQYYLKPQYLPHIYDRNFDDFNPLCLDKRMFKTTCIIVKIFYITLGYKCFRCNDNTEKASHCDACGYKSHFCISAKLELDDFSGTMASAQTMQADKLFNLTPGKIQQLKQVWRQQSNKSICMKSEDLRTHGIQENLDLKELVCVTECADKTKQHLSLHHEAQHKKNLNLIIKQIN